MCHSTGHNTVASLLLAAGLMMLTACAVAGATGRVRLSAASLPWDVEAHRLQPAPNAGQKAPRED